jgi:hypothetical protein
VLLSLSLHEDFIFLTKPRRKLHRVRRNLQRFAGKFITPATLPDSGELRFESFLHEKNPILLLSSNPKLILENKKARIARFTRQRGRELTSYCPWWFSSDEALLLRRDGSVSLPFQIGFVRSLWRIEFWYVVAFESVCFLLSTVPISLIFFGLGMPENALGVCLYNPSALNYHYFWTIWMDDEACCGFKRWIWTSFVLNLVENWRLLEWRKVVVMEVEDEAVVVVRERKMKLWWLWVCYGGDRGWESLLGVVEEKRDTVRERRGKKKLIFFCDFGVKKMINEKKWLVWLVVLKIDHALTYIGEVVSLDQWDNAMWHLTCNKLLWINNIWTRGNWTLTN